MRENKINNEILKQMKKIYYPKGELYIDWMGYRITDINKPSYHHIVKAETLKEKELKTEATIDNGAYLGKKSHELLHKIELLDKELYNSWNELFILINKEKKYPNEELISKIFELNNQTSKIIESKKIHI
ncbi:MAG: hypothetical protein IKE73_01545 [Bacilli bacterium]|nr:hypothetical protein [Bacilli bacterium]